MKNNKMLIAAVAFLLSVVVVTGCNQNEVPETSSAMIVTAEEELKKQETSSTSSAPVEEPNPLNEITFTQHSGAKSDPVPFNDWIMGEYSPMAYDAENLPDPETVRKAPIKVTAVYRGEAYKNCLAAEADYQSIYEEMEGEKPAFEELEFEPYVVEYQILIPKGFGYKEILGTTDFAIIGTDGQLYNKYIQFTDNKVGKSLSGATECKVGDTITMYWVSYVNKTDKIPMLQSYNYTEDPFFFSGTEETTFGADEPTTSETASEPTTSETASLADSSESSTSENVQ